MALQNIKEQKLGLHVDTHAGLIDSILECAEDLYPRSFSKSVCAIMASIFCPFGV